MIRKSIMTPKSNYGHFIKNALTCRSARFWQKKSSLSRRVTFQHFTPRPVVRNGLRDQRPEFFGMVEFSKMAEFMHDDVVGEMLREEGDAVVKVKIAFFGA